MEKKRPHCTLDVVKALIRAGKVRITRTALESGETMGFDVDEMIEVVMELTPKDFYKSMTSYADHEIWQDVYRPVTRAGEVYLKFMVVDDLLILSFKEL